MTKKVRCISPHGGAHNGMRHDGTVVHRLPTFGADADGNKTVTGSYLPDVPAEELRLPPNPGGYIDCPSLSRMPIAVGSVIDVPDDWPINLEHFEWVDAPATTPAPPQPATPAPAPAAPAEGE